MPGIHSPPGVRVPLESKAGRGLSAGGGEEGPGDGGEGRLVPLSTHRPEPVNSRR